QQAVDLQSQTAFNSLNRDDLIDSTSRQTLQHLLENPSLYPVWKKLPIQVELIDSSRYRIFWQTPPGALAYAFKTSTRKIVDTLEYNPTSKTHRWDPKQHVPFFAATDLENEPTPTPESSAQSLTFSPTSFAQKHFFAARYLTTDPRDAQPLSSSQQEPPSTDAGSSTEPDPPIQGPGCNCQSHPSTSTLILILLAALARLKRRTYGDK
ncbi:MAG: MYXO-CTERM sorting domain-containing protein, partial [Myxococcota bacterium]